MARGAECYQVLFGVVAETAAKLLVVNIQIRHRAAPLAPPTVTMEDLLLKILIRRAVQPNSGRIRKHRGREPFRLGLQGMPPSVLRAGI